MFDKRINIFTGHFGSGKTEVAVNYALKLNEQKGNTVVIDMDIVNPFFRTADAKAELESRGVKVMLPMYANTNVDVPALPPEINTIFENKSYNVVLDVGGDDLGARAIGRYSKDILDNSYEMFFVVNTKRPMTDTAEKIEEMIYDIENSARLKVTAIINNTNMLYRTATRDIEKGYEIIKKATSKRNIPIAVTSGFAEALAGLKDEKYGELLIMQKMIKLPWDRGL